MTGRRGSIAARSLLVACDSQPIGTGGGGAGASSGGSSLSSGGRASSSGGSSSSSDAADSSGVVRYGQPVSTGTCAIPLSSVQNNVLVNAVVTVIVNTDSI
jgi:hypothetical protein